MHWPTLHNVCPAQPSESVSCCGGSPPQHWPRPQLSVRLTGVNSGLWHSATDETSADDSLSDKYMKSVSSVHLTSSFSLMLQLVAIAQHSFRERPRLRAREGILYMLVTSVKPHSSFAAFTGMSNLCGNKQSARQVTAHSLVFLAAVTKCANALLMWWCKCFRWPCFWNSVCRRRI